MLAADAGSGADAEALWPLGDDLATALLGLLEVELRGRGLRWRVVARERLEVGRTDEPWPGSRVELGPLRARMGNRAKADWPELVEHFVSSLRHLGTRPARRGTSGVLGDLDIEDSVGAAGGDAATAALVGGTATAWDRAQGSLRSRILPAHAADAVPGTLHRVIADGLVEAVTSAAAPIGAGFASTLLPQFHHPGGELVMAEQARDWGVSVRAVFEAARANVRAAAHLESGRFALDGFTMHALFGPSHYATTHVLWLSEHLAAIHGYNEENGALVVLPHRHLIAVHAIESAAVVDAAGGLLRFAARQFETSPGPISDQLYWWRGGALSRLPSDSIGVGETLHLFPSGPFAELLDRLRAGELPGD
ncbi:MAG: hypothetical protein ACRDSS_05475 [Actinocrinis sp.]